MADDEVIDITGAGAAVEDRDAVPLASEDDEDAPLPARAKRNADGGVTLTFRRPVVLKFKTGDQVREETHTQLTFRRLNGGDVLALQALAPGEMGPAGIARATGIPLAKLRPILERADASDVTAAMAVIGGFFGVGTKTGG